LYCRGKDNGVNILNSIDEGPYKLGTFRETLAESTEGTPQFGPERPRVYSDLNSEERDRYNADIWATNILLQGLPKDIYTLINHYTNAKDIWDNVKMLLKGSELTKEDIESQLYDDFEHFREHREESINDYYQHEAHAKENKMVLERLSQPIAQPTADPLAFLSNVSNTEHGLPSSSTSSITPLTPPHANSTDYLIENLTSTLALLTQSYRTFLPQTNNQLRTSSNPRNQATVQDCRVVVQNVQGRPNRGQGMNPCGGNAAGYGEAQNRVGNVNQGQARPGQARTVKCYNCNGGPDNAFDDDVDEQPV
nr:retrovirus-related Pol polyprotein from transposon TNT 1-94 [Tanacetum cinerariifolium]